MLVEFNDKLVYLDLWEIKYLETLSALDFGTKKLFYYYRTLSYNCLGCYVPIKYLLPHTWW